MKITLVHGKYFNSWEALGLGYIGAYLKAAAKGVRIDFYQGCFDSDETIIEGAGDSDIVAFSCTTPTFPHTVQTALAIKAINPSVRVVVGGYHPSAVPAACRVDGIDQVVVGEGESAMLEIVRGNRDPVVIGRPLHFSDLPWPDRTLIRNERNIQVAYNDNRKRITSFQSHRACPYRCAYCLDGFNKVLYPGSRKAPLRHRDVNDLLDEMQSVTRTYGLDLLKFSDPTWNLSREWVSEFCREKIRRGFDTPFYPNVHAGVGSDEMYRLMAEANCYEIAMGIESGSPKVLGQIGKGASVDMIRRSVRWAKGAGIKIRGYFILGMPEETTEDLRMTEALADELELDEYGFTILCPYPGTQMYDAERHKDVDWERADEYSNDFWRGNHLSNAEIREWQSRLMERFGRRLTGRSAALKQQAVAEGTAPAPLAMP